MNRRGSIAEHGTINTCHRCRGRFPGPGVPRKRHLYCCDKCAAGPGVMDRIRMASAAVALALVGVVVGWAAAQSGVERSRNFESGE